jgi:uncharacterized membrane protein YccC
VATRWGAKRPDDPEHPVTRSPIRRATGWLEAADPGGVRRRHGVRTVVAAIATYATLQAVLALTGGSVHGMAGYGVLAAFICALAIADPDRRDRAVTLAWCVPAFVVATSLAAVSEPVRFLPSAVLLGLVFCAFGARRLGMRAGELAVVTTMGTYFAIGAGVTVPDLGWFVVAAFAGIGWFVLCQLVLIPYDPVRSVRAAVRGYAARLAEVVGGVSESVAGTGSAAVLARGLRRAQLTRRVIEAQFPGARARGGWTAEELTQLQVALYEAELGASQMVDGCADSEALAIMPAEIRTALVATLDALADGLLNLRDPGQMEALATRAEELRDRSMAVLDSAAGADTATPAWVVAGLRIANGGRRVARSVATVRALQAPETTRGTATNTAGASHVPAQRPAGASGAADVTIGGRSLHVTTALGLQAILATGLSMALAWLMGVEHPNWVFWTAFVVIAGSLDESLRRVMQRVAGTVLGVVVGAALAIVLPHDLVWLLVGASSAIFLAIYAAPVSHALFVFWLNVAFVLVYAHPGGSITDILVQRPLMTIIGGGIAALVVTRVLPIRRAGRYVAALGAFLSSVRAGLRQWTSDAGEGVAGAALPVIDAAYRRVEAMGSARESAMPFSVGRQVGDTGETDAAALAVAVARLGTAVELEPERARQPLPVAIAARIDGNIGAILALGGGTPAALVPTLDDLLAAAVPAGPPAPGRSAGPGGRGALSSGSVLAAMVDVHASVVRLGTALATMSQKSN